LPWDIGFLVFGALLVVAGAPLYRAGSSTRRQAITTWPRTASAGEDRTRAQD
jgi:hypothetical protein